MHFEPIGIIHTPFTSLEQMPIQPKGAALEQASILVNKEFASGLKDLNGFSHIYLIYHFHHALRTELEVIPFMDIQSRGVFSTRSPLRPSPIGLSITKLISIHDNELIVEGIDILDKTPLLDIKPYIPQFDAVETPIQTGWMQDNSKSVVDKRSDDRFV